MSTQDYDGLHIPLGGIRLIEASAGTGKTFSLAGLYLRLLLEKPVDVSQILVMTFTRAATRELRERIRLRINQAAQQALSPPADTHDDVEAAFTEALLQRAELPRETLAHRLLDAARRMDEAVIVTIHGYSQRAAADNAFDSALPFDRGEAVDDASVMREVVQDYWRAQTLGQPNGAAFLNFWPNAEKLQKDLEPFSQQPHLQLAGPDAASIQDWSEQTRQLWPQQKQLFEDLLQQALDKGELLKSFSDKLPFQGNIAQLFAQLDQAITACPMALPDWLKALKDPRKAFKKVPAKAAQPVLDELTVLPLLLKLLPAARMQALRQAHHNTLRMATQRKLQRRQYSFSDMISLLHQSIYGEQGDTLAAALYRNWPWALVDEFQDTDPQQYQILQKCYQNTDDDGGLILIGDPKQAIYSFRGGDVHAYLKAARDAKDRRYGLRQNFRSTQSYLQAVETLFRQPADNPFLQPDIVFDSVSAGRGEHSQLIIGDEVQAAMNIWPHQPTDDSDKALNKDIAERACLQACTRQIQQLLDPANPALIRRKNDDGTDTRPVLPRDIAVLVNTNAQASQTQRSLSAAGIAAVCVHQQSVYESEQADDVLRVLRAAANPTDERLLRGALSSSLLACPLAHLIELENDDQGWQQQVDRFQHAHESWRQYGVLALVQKLLQEHAAAVLAQPDGQRRMSNYLQLGELLAELERRHFGMHGVLQAFAQAMAQAQDDKGDKEAEQLRLESDAALVRVVTVHKSKGLEYPILLLPFAPWLGTQGKPNEPPVSYHQQDQALLDLDPNDEATEKAVLERRSEALRLLYVALTRAEIACYWPWGLFNQVQRSAMAALLHRERLQMGSWSGAMSLSQQDIADDLQSLSQAGGDSITLLDWPRDSRTAGSPLTNQDHSHLKARSDWPQPRLGWRMNSFSRLARHSEVISLGGADDEQDSIDVIDEADGEQLPEMPGGTRFGNALHDILEKLDDTSWRQPQAQDAASWNKRIEDAFNHFGVRWNTQRMAHDAVLDNTRGLLINTLISPIDGMGRLQDIAADARRAEMEFHLRAGSLGYGQLLALLQSHGYAQNLAAAHLQDSLRGLLQGYIDLLVEHDGRFYVLDYKSNYLGPQQGHYATSRLAAAMTHHHYDLQQVLYQLALHRYLSQRLPGYDPQQHLGGARYLFMRGMTPQHPGDGVHCAEAKLPLILAMDRLFAGAPA